MATIHNVYPPRHQPHPTKRGQVVEVEPARRERIELKDAAKPDEASKVVKRTVEKRDKKGAWKKASK